MKLFVTVLVEGEYMPKILKKLSENKVEFKLRKETESIDLDLNDVVNHIKEYLHEN